MLVSIIIPTYRDWNRLSKCLTALACQSIPKTDFEIIVANNCPNDYHSPSFEIPINCTIITVSKAGSYAARNAAIKLAQGEIIGFTDSDCVPHKDWIRNAVAALQSRPELARIAGCIELFYLSDKPNRIELYDKFYAFNQEGYVLNNGTAATANMFTYASLFQTVGLFNCELLSGGDFLWGTLANKKGYRIRYCEDVIVFHPARGKLSELVKKEKRVGVGQAGFLAETSRLTMLWSYFKALRPRLRESWYVLKNSSTASIPDALLVVFLRHYLLSVRAYAKLRKQLTPA
ncbi:glycosyltransferase [Dyadobacter arcticus]|uniref:Glycosyltransferase involved in cell wall biosynthesis n=1 Tax=Dyadobacter arcticus TaxID=1078754 RepID=A0ABX0UT77_9BACT|nr:glycosyltransferase family A protein [Dyadobacter arcticus]NIJ54975.1 glycosyltransferase involved in cell wall biosynthesis [Dyadobacter arcticus]